MPFNFRFSGALKRIIESTSHPRTYGQLKSEVAAAVQTAGLAATISTHTLKRLVKEPQNVKLSQQNLIALHCFLKGYGEGLDEKPIFEKHSLLECVAEGGRVSFMFGARPSSSGPHDDVSLWDTKSIAVLIQQIYGVKPAAQFELVDVLLPPAELDQEVLKASAWRHQLERVKQSVIAIGSPRSCLASEVMLASMFGVASFEPPQPVVGGGEALPFYFLWPPRQRRRLRSHFAPAAKDVRADIGQLYDRVMKEEAAGVKLGQKWYPIPLQSQRCDMFGVVVAQRQAGGHVWVVISGISGPATYACATMVPQITQALPATGDPGSPVLWAPVRVGIRRNGKDKKDGDPRSIVATSLEREPQVWRKPEPPR